jgi:hypothetical protein
MKNIPKRIILSRKGFDSSAGGFASPIFPDGRMSSLPIPENAKYPDVTLRFNDLGGSGDQDAGISSIIDRLPRTFDVRSKLHLDPDIRPALRPRNGGDPLGYFGQEGRAMTELQKHGVCDPTNKSLFLFYGWFKGVRVEDDGRLRYETATPRELRTHNQHVIWGWLQVEDAPRLIPKEELRQDLTHIDYHPHIEARVSRENITTPMSTSALRPCRFCGVMVKIAHVERHIEERCPKNPNSRTNLKGRLLLPTPPADSGSVPNRWEWEMTTPNTPFWRRT